MDITEFQVRFFLQVGLQNTQTNNMDLILAVSSSFPSDHGAEEATINGLVANLTHKLNLQSFGPMKTLPGLF